MAALLRLGLLWMLVALVLAVAPTAGAVVDGDLDTTHDYVVFVGQRVVYETPGGATINVGGSACSGTLVAADVVVTAAHCRFVPAPPASVPTGSRFVGVAGYLVRRGPSVLVPPQSWVGGVPPFEMAMGTLHVQNRFPFAGGGLPHFSDNDLAVVRLSAPLPGPYATLPSLGIASTLRPTHDLTVVGYGVSAMHGSTPVGSSFDGRRRQAHARLLPNRAVADDLLLFGGNACFGDSGGPLLDGDVVLGVTSFAPSACKSTSYATRLDTADSLAFVKSFLAP